MPVIKLTLAGTICTRDGSARLWIHFRGRKIHTGLRNTRGGLAMAESMLEKLWREETGIQPVTQQVRRTVDKSWEEFIAERRATRAPRTILWYEQAQRYVFGEDDSKLTIEAVETAVLKYLRSTRIGSATKRIMLTAVRAWCSWCVRKGYLLRHPVPPEYLPKVQPKQIRVFAPEELRALIQHFAVSRPELSHLLRFLALTGFRIGETLSLQWEAVLSDRIVLPSKDKARAEFYPRNTPLDELLAEMHPCKSGRVWTWSPATTSRLTRWLADGMRDCGIEQNGRSFHAIRKTRWSELAGAGVPLTMAAKLMRNTISTAERHYITHSIEDLRHASEFGAFKNGRKMGMYKHVVGT